mmetsp:Transcript_204/g.437  ORF Transcript_204/g.437 Transcript_204/m.437 type:complete len:90 (+) Transcript_204:951-1220(+)
MEYMMAMVGMMEVTVEVLVWRWPVQQIIEVEKRHADRLLDAGSDCAKPTWHLKNDDRRPALAGATRSRPRASPRNPANVVRAMSASRRV